MLMNNDRKVDPMLVATTDDTDSLSDQSASTCNVNNMDPKHSKLKTTSKKPGRPAKKSGKKASKYKKNPNAPKRFRSAFIIFSQQKHREIRHRLQESGQEKHAIDIAKMVSDEWRKITPEDRRKWEDLAEKDKIRYMQERVSYAGPWKVRANVRRKKDPNSPKKPIPAYFAFSNARRQAVKNAVPKATNAEISKILSRMWKDEPQEVRDEYLAEEKRQREVYAESMKEWKKKEEEKERNEKSKKERLSILDVLERKPAAMPSNEGEGAGQEDGSTAGGITQAPPAPGSRNISYGGVGGGGLGLGGQAGADPGLLQLLGMSTQQQGLLAQEQQLQLLYQQQQSLNQGMMLPLMASGMLGAGNARSVLNQRLLEGSSIQADEILSSRALDPTRSSLVQSMIESNRGHDASLAHAAFHSQLNLSGQIGVGLGPSYLGLASPYSGLNGSQSSTAANSQLLSSLLLQQQLGDRHGSLPSHVLSSQAAQDALNSSGMFNNIHRR